MKRKIRILSALPVLFLTAAFASAKDPAPAAAQAKPSPAAKPAQPTGDSAAQPMMGMCRMEGMSTRDSVAAAQKAVRGALQSDDKARMKAALQKSDSLFTRIQDHMARCMDAMHGPHGGMRGMHRGGNPSAPAPANP